MKPLSIIRIVFGILIAIALILSIYKNLSFVSAQKQTEKNIISFVDGKQDFIDEITEYLECDRKAIYQQRIDESQTGIEKLNSFESMLSYIEDSYVKMTTSVSETGLNSENAEDYDKQKKNTSYSEQIIDVRREFNELRDDFQKNFMNTDE